MTKRAPHYRTPDYPRSKVAKYVVTVMQLFDPQCEGHFVTHVEHKCEDIWKTLNADEKTIARARVEVLHTLFADPNAKRSTIFEVLHEKFDIDRFLVWYDSAKGVLEAEGPEFFARAAYKAGQDDSDDQLRERCNSLQRSSYDLTTWLDQQIHYCYDQARRLKDRRLSEALIMMSEGDAFAETLHWYKTGERKCLAGIPHPEEAEDETTILEDADEFDGLRLRGALDAALSYIYHAAQALPEDDSWRIAALEFYEKNKKLLTSKEASSETE